MILPFTFKIQEALFNVGSHVNFVTLAHLNYFPTKYGIVWNKATVIK